MLEYLRINPDWIVVGFGLFEKIGYTVPLLLLALYYLSHPALINAEYIFPPEGSYLWVNKNIIMMVNR